MAYTQYSALFISAAIILAIVELIIILLLIFLRKRILIAIALIKEASRCVKCMGSIVTFNVKA